MIREFIEYTRHQIFRNPFFGVGLVCAGIIITVSAQSISIEDSITMAGKLSIVLGVCLIVYSLFSISIGTRSRMH